MHVRPAGRRGTAAGAIAGVLATTIAIASADAPPAGQSTIGSSRPSERFSAIVTIRQSQLDAESRPLPGSPPAMTFRLDRSSDGGGGRALAMTLIGAERAVVQGIGGMRALDHPFMAARMEHDARNGLRLYDARGGRIRIPDGSDRALFGHASDGILPRMPASADGREPAAAWLDDVLVTPEARRERRAELERAHGPAQGSVRGLDRFVTTDGTNVDEVLVDPATALPVETNALRAGTLVARTWMKYATHPGGFFVRRLLRSERIVPSRDGRRLAVEIEVSDVQRSNGGDK